MWACCAVLVCAFWCALLLKVLPEGLLCENLNLLYNRSPSKGVSH